MEPQQTADQHLPHNGPQTTAGHGTGRTAAGDLPSRKSTHDPDVGMRQENTRASDAQCPEPPAQRLDFASPQNTHVSGGGAFSTPVTTSTPATSQAQSQKEMVNALRDVTDGFRAAVGHAMKKINAEDDEAVEPHYDKQHSISFSFKRDPPKIKDGDPDLEQYNLSLIHI